jgi:DNA-directed RNA polymerase specialized sigma24 family protein
VNVLKVFLSEMIRLYGLIISKVGNPVDAEDIFHDTVFAALKDIDILKDHQNFGMWFYRIAKHRIADYWRKKITVNETNNHNRSGIQNGKPMYHRKSYLQIITTMSGNNSNTD